MEEIRIVNRAKWMLIDRLHLTEQEAHRMIEKRAMDRCVTRRVIAEEILADEKETPRRKKGDRSRRLRSPFLILQMKKQGCLSAALSLSAETGETPP